MILKMSGKNFDILIEREKKNIKSYKAKITELEKKVKEAEIRLKDYEMKKNSQMFTEMAGILQNTGISMDEVIAAMQNGNLLDLQEKIEESQKISESVLESGENNFDE